MNSFALHHISIFKRNLSKRVSVHKKCLVLELNAPLNGLPLVRQRICQVPCDCHSWSNTAHPYRPMHSFIIASAEERMNRPSG